MTSAVAWWASARHMRCGFDPFGGRNVSMICNDAMTTGV